MDALKEVAAIRKVIKGRCRTLSVSNGRGTAWGWVQIRGSGQYGEFTEAENATLKALGLPAGGNYAVISPDARPFVLRRLTGEGEGRRCLACGAQATGTFFCPCDLEHFTCDAHRGITDCARVGREA